MGLEGDEANMEMGAISHLKETVVAVDHDLSPEQKTSGEEAKEEEEVNDCPIEQVRLTVPITDDPDMPCLTFRTWSLGLVSCFFLSVVNQFFGYRQNAIGISSICVQIVALPVGRMMAATLPHRPVRVPLIGWSFSLNPGPFNLKEHVLITIFANAGAGGVYALSIVDIVKAFYHRKINPVAGLLLSNTTQLLGYGWAGLFRTYLVDSAYMWWPGNLIQVSLFRALHEDEKRKKGGVTRLQFFILVFITSFVYYTVPNYFFPSISTLAVACWFWKNSVTAQQIGSGLGGLGIGSFGLDWATASFIGSPLATPAFSIFNTLAGYVLVMYVVLPITYWTDMYDAKKFPIFTSTLYDNGGQTYNITRILDEKTFSINYDAYNAYSKINLSVFFSFAYGFSFATLTASVTHVGLFYGKSIWEMWRKTASSGSQGDVHTRIMKRNYETVPQWWFHIILILVLALSFFTCEGFNHQLQLPYWGILLGCALAVFFTLPIGVLNATTNQGPGLNVITELVIGYLYPGKPLANVTFKTYGYISMLQALTFLADFKLGHYMKIPPKSMFVVQLVGTVVASSAYFGTAWWMLTKIKNICDISLLPVGSQWTCPGDDVFYSASIIWGVVGPRRMFGTLGLYSSMNWFFLFGFLCPIPLWLLSRAYPEKKWIPLINMPVILSATGAMPAAKAVHYVTWFAVGITFNFIVYRRYKKWWAKYNYVLSAGLDSGVAFMGLLAYFALQNFNIYGLNWWGAAANDHCLLASCPTAPGIVVDGCPTFTS